MRNKKEISYIWNCHKNPSQKFRIDTLLRHIQLYFFSVSLLFVSCSAPEFDSILNSFSRTEMGTFVLPDWKQLDDNYPVLSGWQVSFYSGTSDKSFSFSEFFIKEEDTNSNKIQIELAKNRPTFIIARPVTLDTNMKNETLFFMPAGTVYPFLKKSDENTFFLSFEDGWISSILENLLLSAKQAGSSYSDCYDFISKFNWKRFSSILKEKQDNCSFYNPWTLSSKKIIEAIMGTKFTSTLLNVQNPVYFDESFFSCHLSPYIPLNESLCSLENSTKIPLWRTKDNGYQDRFLINADKMILFYEDPVGTIMSGSKKLSKTTVFLPKKYEETVYAKN